MARTAVTLVTSSVRRPLVMATILGMIIFISACTTAQLDKVSATATRVEPALERACDAAVQLSLIAGLVPGVGAIVPYINEGCRTAQGVAKLAADPDSLAWLGILRGKIEVLASRAGVKLPSA